MRPPPELVRGREQYQRLFEDLLGKRFDVVVIKSQDRLMRNTKDWYIFIDRLVSCRKKLYLYLEQRFYTADDSLITGIKAILAEEYSRELSRKINNAHKATAAGPSPGSSGKKEFENETEPVFPTPTSAG